MSLRVQSSKSKHHARPRAPAGLDEAWEAAGRYDCCCHCGADLAAQRKAPARRWQNVQCGQCGTYQGNRAQDGFSPGAAQIALVAAAIRAAKEGRRTCSY